MARAPGGERAASARRWPRREEGESACARAKGCRRLLTRIPCRTPAPPPGKEFRCDSIVACTGYRNAFPIFLSPDTLHERVAGTNLTYAELGKRKWQKKTAVRRRAR